MAAGSEWEAALCKRQHLGAPEITLNCAPELQNFYESTKGDNICRKPIDAVKWRAYSDLRPSWIHRSCLHPLKRDRDTNPLILQLATIHGFLSSGSHKCSRYIIMRKISNTWNCAGRPRLPGGRRPMPKRDEVELRIHPVFRLGLLGYQFPPIAESRDIRLTDGHAIIIDF